MSKKPLIIINCGDEKATSPCCPIEMYCGKNSMSSLIQASKNQDIVDEYKRHMFHGPKADGYIPPRFNQLVDIYVLSAKWGLINAFGSPIKPYDNRLPTDPAGVEAYISDHKRATCKTLRELDIQSRTVYICLVNNYKKALFGMAGHLLEQVRDIYVSENHLGIGELRGRLSKVVRSIASGWVGSSSKYSYMDSTPIVFNSGASTASEISIYADDLSNVGSSLHYMNFKRGSKGIAALLNIVNKSCHLPFRNNIFIDNGFISNPNLNVGWVLDQYEKILSKCYNPNKVTIVLPDSLDPVSAIEILKVYKEQILRICSYYPRVVLPVHDVPTIAGLRAHVKGMLEQLDYHPALIAGVPCLNNRKYGYGKIEAILSIKNPKTDRPAFGGVHFLGLGKSIKRVKAYSRRLRIARVHDMASVSFDSNRANAIWGSKKAPTRRGTKIIAELESQIRLTPDQRESFTDITSQYDAKILKSLYCEKLNINSAPIALRLLNEHLPEKLRVRIDDENLTDDLLKRRVNQSIIPLMRATQWAELAKKSLLSELIELQLIEYNPSEAFNYYEKRRISFRKLSIRTSG